IRRCLDPGHTDRALRLCHIEGARYRFFVAAVGDRKAFDAKALELVVQEEVGAAIDWLRANERIAWRKKGEKCSRRGSHSTGEDRRVLATVQRRETLFRHFEIGMTQPAVDEAMLFDRLSVDEGFMQRLRRSRGGIDKGRRHVERRLGAPQS